jgi:hypothetical protein
VSKLPFHAWKANQVKADSRPGCTVYREREWYWKEYGHYCQRVAREAAATGGKGGDA